MSYAIACTCRLESACKLSLQPHGEAVLEGCGLVAVGVWRRKAGAIIGAFVEDAFLYLLGQTCRDRLSFAKPCNDISTMAATSKNEEQLALARSLKHVPWCAEYEKMISGML